MQTDTKQRCTVYIVALTAMFGTALAVDMFKDRRNQQIRQTQASQKTPADEENLLLSPIGFDEDYLWFLTPEKDFLAKLPRLKERYPEFYFITTPPTEDQAEETLFVIVKKKKRE